MGFEAKIIKHSISPDDVPICTMEVTFPRIILAELNTHRMFSRNSASSRAIPIEKMLARVREDAFIPESFPSNGKGMKEGAPLEGRDAEQAREMWLNGASLMETTAAALGNIGLQKGYTNRLLEPWLWHTAIITSTEWDNFFNLRAHPEAHGEMQTIAALMKEAYAASTPEKLDYGKWHLPYIFEEDYELARQELKGWNDADLDDVMVQVSIGRCARVSYLTHDGKRDLAADINLFTRLGQNGHMSPFEHVARPAQPSDRTLDTCMAKLCDVRPDIEYDITVDPDQMWFGNHRGWVQYRKTIAGEHDMLGSR